MNKREEAVIKAARYLYENPSSCTPPRTQSMFNSAMECGNSDAILLASDYLADRQDHYLDIMPLREAKLYDAVVEWRRKREDE